MDKKLTRNQKAVHFDTWEHIHEVRNRSIRMRNVINAASLKAKKQLKGFHRAAELCRKRKMSQDSKLQTPKVLYVQMVDTFGMITPAICNKEDSGSHRYVLEQDYGI